MIHMNYIKGWHGIFLYILDILKGVSDHYGESFVSAFILLALDKEYFVYLILKWTFYIA